MPRRTRRWQTRVVRRLVRGRSTIANGYPGQIIGYRRDGTPIRLLFGGAGPAFVQHAANSAQSVSTLTVTLGSNTTAGNCLVVCIAATTGTPSVSSVKLGGSAGNFSQLVSNTNTFIWADPNCAGSQTAVAVTLNASFLYVMVDVFEFSGVATTSPLDKSSSGSGSTTSWTSGTTATTTSANEAWVGFGNVYDAGSTTCTITGPSSGGWTNESAQTASNGTNGDSMAQVAGYQIVTSTGTATYSGTDTGTLQGTEAIVVTLKPAIVNITSTGSVTLGGKMTFAATGAGGNTTSTGAMTLKESLSAGGVETFASTGAMALNPGFVASGLVAPQFPVNVLGLKIELLLNGTWNDISGFVYQRSVITITRGRPNEQQSIQAAQMSMILNNRDARFTPKNSSGAYYPFITRNTQIRVHVLAASMSGVVYNGYRFWGEVASWPPQSDQTGNDVTVTISAAGIMQRLNQNTRTMGSAIKRYLTRLTGASVPAAYWTNEDMTSATSFASALSGGSAMTWTGTPSLSSSSAFMGSDNLPELNGSVWTGSVTNNPFTPSPALYTTPGTYTWTAPGDVSSITTAEAWGGGGMGGVADNTSSAGGTGLPAFVGPFDGQTSSFAGNSVTVTAHGGGAGNAVMGNGNGFATGGPAGTGSTNTTHHDGGAGATAGNHSGVTAGGGGGSSGGSAAAGNAGGGTSPGNPGTAVTGGGPGGEGGCEQFGDNNNGLMPTSGPGGGGGGSGDFNPNGPNGGGGGGGEYAKESSVAVTPGSNYTVIVGAGGPGSTAQDGRVSGAGYAGQIKLTYTTAGVPAANVLRFLLDVPSGGGVVGAIYGEMLTTGTIAKIDVVYGAGGTLKIIGYNSGNTQLFASTAAGAYNGVPVIVSVELTPSGTSVNWALKTIPPGISSSATTVASGTQASASLGSASTVNANVGGTETGAVVVGHYIVQYAVSSLTDLAAAASGYNGERAGTRFLRLLAEESIGAVLTGNASDTPQMGPQPDTTLVTALQQVEDLDRGQLYETTSQFGLGYRTRVNMQNQSSVFSLDYSLARLSPTFAPTYDDQLTRNSIQLTRGNGGNTTGSSVTAEDDSGAMSVNQPPNGVGFYSYQLTVNAFQDSQLANEASWMLTLGTIDDFRYPSVVVDLTRVATESLFASVPGANVGDYFTIPNLPAWMPSGTANQLAYGFQENLNAFVWNIAINAVPESPYTGAGLPTW